MATLIITEKEYYPKENILVLVEEKLNCLGCKLDLKKLVRGEGEKITCPECKGYNFLALKPKISTSP